jgi:hypothetical protein
MLVLDDVLTAGRSKRQRFPRKNVDRNVPDALMHDKAVRSDRVSGPGVGPGPGDGPHVGKTLATVGIFLLLASPVGLIDSVTKLLNPAAARAREEELGVVVETPKRDDTHAAPDLVCRICGHRQAQGPFCPVCLAETMERVPPTP